MIFHVYFLSCFKDFDETWYAAFELRECYHKQMWFILLVLRATFLLRKILSPLDECDETWCTAQLSYDLISVHFDSV
jgi:hypothetical protein